MVDKCENCYPKLCYCPMTPQEVIDSRALYLKEWGDILTPDEFIQVIQEVKEAKRQLKLADETIQDKQDKELA